MNQKDKIYLLKWDVAGLPRFKRYCNVCRSPMRPSLGFVFHHCEYVKDDKTWRDFRDADGKYGLKEQLEYTRYIIVVIRKEPRRFLLLCHKDHYALEKLKRYSDLRLKRLLKARKMSK